MASGDKIFLVRLDKMMDEIRNRDGQGSLVDADLLDGKDASEFAAAVHSYNDVYYQKTEVDTFLNGKAAIDLANVDNSVILEKLKLVDGTASGLDADTLDGFESTHFATATHLHDDRYYPKTDADAKFVDKAGDTIDGDLVITGNLTVNGTQTVINSETLSVADNIIKLNSDFTTGSPTANAGIEIVRGDEPSVEFRWNEASKVGNN